MKIIKIAQQIMFMGSLSLLKKKKEKKRFWHNFKAWHRKVNQIDFFIITYWHACVGYPFEPSILKEKVICLSNMFVAH